MSPEELKCFRTELEKDASMRTALVMGRKYGRSIIRSGKKFGTGMSRWARGKSWSPIKKPPKSVWAGRKEMISGGALTIGAAGTVGVGGTGYWLLTQPKSIRNLRQF